MDFKAILNLMKEMNQTDLTKVELESDGLRICMEKAKNEPVVVTAAPVSMPQQFVSAAPTFSAPPTSAAAPEVNEVVEKKPEIAAGNKVTSPMVGTFYSQPSPDKPTFVKVGDKVKKGQTLCIIEAMKLMNEIESEFDGEVVEILVKNEEMVEYGQTLFVIQ